MKRQDLAAMNAELNALDWDPPLRTLPYLNQQARRACPKPTTRKTLKGRKTRAEARIIKAVRAQCVERDGYCIVLAHLLGFTAGLLLVDTDLGGCFGPSAWAHMHDKRRSKTRGQAPEVRHTTASSFMACQRHHLDYDQKRLFITALSRKGADGPLKFRRAAR